LSVANFLFNVDFMPDHLLKHCSGQPELISNRSAADPESERRISRNHNKQDLLFGRVPGFGFRKLGLMVLDRSRFLSKIRDLVLNQEEDSNEIASSGERIPLKELLSIARGNRELDESCNVAPNFWLARWNRQSFDLNEFDSVIPSPKNGREKSEAAGPRTVLYDDIV
jgi:hypothetical protein